MYETPNSILQLAAELNLPAAEFRQLGSRDWKPVLRQVLERFATTHSTDLLWLWEFLRQPHASIELEYALPVLEPLFAPDTPVWLITEDWHGDKKHGNYWVFETTWSAAIAVLGNLFRIEYYLVDRKFEWMLLENHHSYVVGIGEPALSLVRDLRQRYPDRAKG